MTYNLLEEAWIPVIRADQSRDCIAPWQIAETDNPVIALAAPRPDFNGTLMQFLIGLLQTAHAPKNSILWSRGLETPPNPEVLRETFARYRHAFNLDGDGSRFMQDLDPLNEQQPLPMTALLIDTAGSETHFIKNLPEQGLSPALAAMALYTLQTNAPSGGAGHRTSLRGGGPLTTLVMAQPTEAGPPVPLWQTLWINVLPAAAFASDLEADADIFPWLAPTRVSDKTSKTPMTTPAEVNPLQAFWGMPRRIRLDFEQVGKGECGLSGVHSDLLVRYYRTRNYGVNYGGNWEHSLSPHNRGIAEIIPLHPRGAIQYRHWLGLVQEIKDRKSQRVPARVVTRFRVESLDEKKNLRLRLWAFGFDMDNMKPRGWYEGTLPLFHIDDLETRQRFEATSENLVKAADEFLGNLRSCLKAAWFDPDDPRSKSTDSKPFQFLDAAFWADTEGDFYALLERLLSSPNDAVLRQQVYRDWHQSLHQYTLRTFHRQANTSAIAEQNPRRIAQAFRKLKSFNHKKQIKILLEMPSKSPNTP